MADEFDDLLKASLAPEERAEDRQFVMRVAAAVRMDEQLRAERAAILGSLGVKLVALAAMVGAVMSIGQAPAVADFMTSSPAIAVAILILGFAALLALFSSGGERPIISAA